MKESDSDNSDVSSDADGAVEDEQIMQIGTTHDSVETSASRLLRGGVELPPFGLHVDDIVRVISMPDRPTGRIVDVLTASPELDVALQVQVPCTLQRQAFNFV